MYTNQPFTISNSCTIYALSDKAGYDWLYDTNAYTITASTNTVQTPLFSQPAGTYGNVVTVAITCETPGSTIYYSKNNWITTNTYHDPVSLYSSATLRAYATLEGWTDSAIQSVSYVVEAVPSTVQNATVNSLVRTNWH